MSNIVANVLNKRVVHEFQQYPRWWELITLARELHLPPGHQLDRSGRVDSCPR